jgi:hypothetical protein
MAEESTGTVEDEEQGSGESGSDAEGKGEEAQKAKEKEEEREQAAEKVKELEEDPPDDLEEWPDDAAKYETFGGPEGEHGYHEGPEEKLGPSSLRHHEGGGVTVAGDEVDDPDEYKSDPIPGGPTDPDAKQDLTQQKIRESQGRDDGEDGDDSGDDDSPEQQEDAGG